MKTEEQEIDRGAIAALTLKRGFTPAAIRAMLKARRMLSLAAASAIASLRDDPDTIPHLYARTIEGNINVSLLEWQSSLLHARMSRVQPCHRPHYTPSERYQILVHKQTFGLSLTQIADMVLVSEQTITRWMTEATNEPDKETIGSLLKASPPLMGYSQVVRDLVTQMGQFGFGGNLKIAQTLARAGVKLSKETARRWRNNPKSPHPPKDLPAEP
ncbi:MAG TPA: hypothetical protein VJX67_11325, partial [Blastocatellia bacterium]|nr:hypothetical protein [Blastocatellia bacterium]